MYTIYHDFFEMAKEKHSRDAIKHRQNCVSVIYYYFAPYSSTLLQFALEKPSAFVITAKVLNFVNNMKTHFEVCGAAIIYIIESNHSDG